MQIMPIPDPMSLINTYHIATSIGEAISLGHGMKENFRFVAGGTDLMVNKVQGNDSASHLIDITGIEDLKLIEQQEDSLRIGSLVSLDDLIHNSLIQTFYPVLATAAKTIASPVIRKTATLGGNLLCHNRCAFYNQSEWWREAAGYCLKSGGDTCLASGGKKYCYAKFVSDMAVPLISLNATIEITGINGMQQIPLEQIYTGNGLQPVNLDAHSIITAVLLKPGQVKGCSFQKLRRRASIDFTSLTVAVMAGNNGLLRAVLGGVHAAPVVAERSKSMTFDEFAGLLIEKTRIVDNDTYSRMYRKEMVSVLLRRCLQELEIED
jgi:4-hydroxybenzoyl-CoA reductase subunit beta